MKITNNSRAPQGVHSTTGLVFIEPGQTCDIDVAESYVERVKALPFLGIEGVARDFTHAPSAPYTGVDPLDHDADGKKGGAKKLGPLPDNLDDLKRDELDALAAERGVDISEAKNKGDVIAALQLAAE